MLARQDVLTPLGLQMLADLPPFLRDDPDYMAVIHCHAREIERLEAAIEQVRAEVIPVTASGFGLDAYEDALRLPADPSLDVSGRQERIVARYASLAADPSMRAFVERLTARLGTSAWRYEENTPVGQSLRFHLPWASGSDAWNEAVRAIREEAPAEQALSFVSAGGFLLDVSEMDVEGLGV